MKSLKLLIVILLLCCNSLNTEPTHYIKSMEFSGDYFYFVDDSGVTKSVPIDKFRTRIIKPSEGSAYIVYNKDGSITLFISEEELDKLLKNDS